MLPDGKKEMRIAPRYPMTGTLTVPEGAPQGSGHFAWPTEGVLTQAYWSGHQAIDIANRAGIPVRAADDGYVLLSGHDAWGYGNQILIDHGNGYRTGYGHLDTLLVRAGDFVRKNQEIGTMGSTGRTTGPALDFRIWEAGEPVDPLPLLP
jgi:murein DD-endopeptidase MepM/ murein hydrolase activator NlpD